MEINSSASKGEKYWQNIAELVYSLFCPLDSLSTAGWASTIDMQLFGCVVSAMDQELDPVFKALADRTRRRLLDRLFANNGQTLSELCTHLDMTRQAVTKHLTLLEAANLVVTLWRGREKLHYLNPEPIEAIAERWIGKYERHRVQALRDLKRALEDGDSVQ